MITSLMRSLTNILVASLLIIEIADAYFVSISDKSYPFITDVGSGLTIAWSYGNYAQLTRSGVALRVNERGVNFVHVGNMLDVISSSYWEVHDCYDSTTSLCVLNDGSRLFPFDRVNIASNRTMVKSEMQSISSYGCQRTRDAKRLVSDKISVYDISLCDVVDSRLDVLYLNMENKVLFRRNSTALWIYVLVSIVSVYLVSNIAQNVSVLLTKDKIKTKFHKSRMFWVFEISTIAISIVFILIPCLFEMALITNIELLYCIFGIVYVTLHAFYYAYRYFVQRDNSGMLSFNLITGTLLLLTQGVYNTIANPYSGILLFMLSLRCFYKIFEYHTKERFNEDLINNLEDDKWKYTRSQLLYFSPFLYAFFMLLDVVLLVLTYYIGLRQTFLYRFSSDVSFVLILLFSWVVCEFIKDS